MNNRKMIIIDNDKFIGKYSTEFIEFCKENKIKIPKIKSRKGQAIALLTKKENLNKYIDRENLTKFFNNQNMKSSDPIQCINKTDQWGLVGKTEEKKYYTIPYPFQYTDLHIKKRKFNKISGDKDEMIDNTKKYLMENYIDIANDKWQKGHKNPDIDDNSEENLVYQPPIQGKFRNRFKFDSIGLLKIPTSSELIENFDIYYTIEEQQNISNNLNKKFHK